MKKVLLLPLLTFLLFNISSVSAGLYSDSFKENVCLQIKESFISEVPSEYRGTFSGTKERFKTLSEVTMGRDVCRFYEETDISLKIEVDLMVRHHEPVPDDLPGSQYPDPLQELAAVMECYFTSQYEWNCAYTIVTKNYARIPFFPPFLPLYIQTRQYNIDFLQTNFLNIVSSELTENY